MLAWENPYSKDGESHVSLENSYSQMKLVREEAFVQIAPAVAGVTDISTTHHLYKALAGGENGISLSLWMAYIAKLIKFSTLCSYDGSQMGLRFRYVVLVQAGYPDQQIHRI